MDEFQMHYERSWVRRLHVVDCIYMTFGKDKTIGTEYTSFVTRAEDEGGKDHKKT